MYNLIRLSWVFVSLGGVAFQLKVDDSPNRKLKENIVKQFWLYITEINKKYTFFVKDIQRQLDPKTTSRKVLVGRCNQFF